MGGSLLAPPAWGKQPLIPLRSVSSPSPLSPRRGSHGGAGGRGGRISRGCTGRGGGFGTETEKPKRRGRPEELGPSVGVGVGGVPRGGGGTAAALRVVVILVLIVLILIILVVLGGDGVAERRGMSGQGCHPIVPCSLTQSETPTLPPLPWGALGLEEGLGAGARSEFARAQLLGGRAGAAPSPLPLRGGSRPASCLSFPPLKPGKEEA